MSYKNTILIVDDEENMCLLLSKILRNDFQVLTVNKGDDALNVIKEKDIDLVLLDQNMPELGGLDTLKLITQYDNYIPVIMITAYGRVSFAVEAMKLSAKDYIEKPFDPKKTRNAVAHALEIRNLNTQIKQLRSELIERNKFNNIISKSTSMSDIFKLIENVASTDISVLITGASGTGKELVARAVHYSGNYKNRPFIAINCAAIPDQLLESELFGYEKGAFSGAANRKIGKIEMADQGTLFLDELGDMNGNTQAKLLRFLQDGKFERVGGLNTIQVHTRIISATNKDIKELLKLKHLREDLYFRINGIHIELPPLSARIEDILLLTTHFIEKFNPDFEKNIKGVKPEAKQLLLDYDWPGNIRELQMAIKSAMALSTDEFIEAVNLPKSITDYQVLQPINNDNVPLDSFDNKIGKMEISLIKDALGKSQNNRTHAAKLLKVSLRKLHHKMNKYGLQSKE